MKYRLNVIAGLFSAVFLLVLISGCTEGARVGELQTKTETIELGSNDFVNVEIDIGAGELEIDGDAAELLEAVYTYNFEELDPGAVLSNGTLKVSHSDIKEGIGTLLDFDEFRNDWDLQLNNDVPMDMSINLGAGRTDLSLGSLDLEGLDINAGAGDVSLDLKDSKSLEDLVFKMGAGEVNLDLSGDWQTDLNANIDGGVGDLTLVLPSNVGVRVVVDTGIGEVNASGFQREGDAYINDAYGSSDVSMDIKIDAGIGRVGLQLD